MKLIIYSVFVMILSSALINYGTGSHLLFLLEPVQKGKEQIPFPPGADSRYQGGQNNQRHLLKPYRGNHNHENGGDDSWGLSNNGRPSSGRPGSQWSVDYGGRPNPNGYSGSTGTSSGFDGNSGGFQPFQFSVNPNQPGFSSNSGVQEATNGFGSSGFSGPSGTSGISGTSGTSGNSEISGISGISGTSGTSGSSHMQRPSSANGFLPNTPSSQNSRVPSPPTFGTTHGGHNFSQTQNIPRPNPISTTKFPGSAGSFSSHGSYGPSRPGTVKGSVPGTFNTQIESSKNPSLFSSLTPSSNRNKDSTLSQTEPNFHDQTRGTPSDRNDPTIRGGSSHSNINTDSTKSSRESLPTMTEGSNHFPGTKNDASFTSFNSFQSHNSKHGTDFPDMNIKGNRGPVKNRNNDRTSTGTIGGSMNTNTFNPVSKNNRNRHTNSFQSTPRRNPFGSSSASSNKRPMGSFFTSPSSPVMSGKPKDPPRTFSSLLSPSSSSSSSSSVGRPTDNGKTPPDIEETNQTPSTTTISGIRGPFREPQRQEDSGSDIHQPLRFGLCLTLAVTVYIS